MPELNGRFFRSLLLEFRFRLVNRFSVKPVTRPGGPVVSITSYGRRIGRVFLALESIATGDVLPERFILWLNDPEVVETPPNSLRRLRKRGLEILLCDDLGPHKKYFPALSLPEVLSGTPLVTADDDTFYPRGWLTGLVANSVRYPSSVIAHRAYEMVTTEQRTVAPYNTWPHAAKWASGPRLFPTGMGGVLYPAAATAAIRAAGNGFLGIAPRADDVWLHSVTSRAGICGVKIGETNDRTGAFLPIRAVGEVGLTKENVDADGNDAQIRATYRSEDIERLHNCEHSARRLTLVAVLAESRGDGGAERFIDRLSAHLKDRGTGSVLVGNISGWKHGPAVRVGLGKKWRTLGLVVAALRLPAQRARVSRALDAVDPDVIHCHFKREQVGLAETASRHAPIIWTEHGIFPGGVFGLALRPLYRRASRIVDTIACVSTVVQDNIAPIVLSNSNVTVIENAIATDHFRAPTRAERTAAKVEAGVGEAEPVVLVIGRLEKSKRPALGIDAALAVGGSALIVGSGPLEQQLRSNYATNPNVRFAGTLDDPRQAYWAADALVFSSDGDGEGAPTVVLEAAAVGLPIVSLTDSGFSKWVEHFNGYSAEPTVDSIAATLELVRHDRRFEQQGPVNSRAKVTDVEMWADSYARLYENVATAASLRRENCVETYTVTSRIGSKSGRQTS